MKDEEYCHFNSKIIGETRYELIGVRLPDLRNYAKKLLKKADKPVFEDRYYEEVLLHGIYIAGYKCDFERKIEMIEDYLPLIDCWGICDSFVTSLKQIKKNRSTYYPYVLKYLSSEEEFIQRYALVVLLDHYMTDEYLSEEYRIIKEQRYSGYYSIMAGAWLLSYLFIFHFEETLRYVKEEKINEEVRKKGIRKALDSLRLNDSQKKILRSL